MNAELIRRRSKWVLLLSGDSEQEKLMLRDIIAESRHDDTIKATIYAGKMDTYTGRSSAIILEIPVAVKSGEVP